MASRCILIQKEGDELKASLQEILELLGFTRISEKEWLLINHESKFIYDVHRDVIQTYYSGHKITKMSLGQFVDWYITQ